MALGALRWCAFLHLMVMCEEGLNHRFTAVIIRIVSICTRAGRTEFLWIATCTTATGCLTTAGRHFDIVGVSCGSQAAELDEIWIVFMPSLHLHFCCRVGQRVLGLALLRNELESGHVVWRLSQTIAHSLQVGELVQAGISLFIFDSSKLSTIVITTDVFYFLLDFLRVRILWHILVFNFHVATPLRQNLSQLLLGFGGSMSMILWWDRVDLILLNNCFRLFQTWRLIDHHF